MNARPKENLVLVNAFLTNSLVLQGLIDYLGRYVRVHFIDLPGFISRIPPLDEVTLENYAAYVQSRIDDLNLDSYLLGGISFGFAVINHLEPDERCKGVVAITPYLSSRWLNLGLMKKSAYSILVNLTLAFEMHSWIWNHRLFHRAFHWYSDYPADRIETLLNEMEGRTFFETARIILTHRKLCCFQNLPHVLILSHSDRTIKNGPLLDFFEKNIDRLKVVRADIDHYPREVSDDYFQARLSQEDMQDIIVFFGGQSSASFS
jgi:pimeloyl-ACP methyl ester carboxylesterase